MTELMNAPSTPPVELSLVDPNPDLEPDPTGLLVATGGAADSARRSWKGRPGSYDQPPQAVRMPQLPGYARYRRCSQPISGSAATGGASTAGTGGVRLHMAARGWHSWCWRSWCSYRRRRSTQESAATGMRRCTQSRLQLPRSRQSRARGHRTRPDTDHWRCRPFAAGIWCRSQSRTQLRTWITPSVPRSLMQTANVMVSLIQTVAAQLLAGTWGTH
jgi:hypothetical protein